VQKKKGQTEEGLGRDAQRFIGRSFVVQIAFIAQQLLDAATTEAYTARYEVVSIALIFDGFVANKHGCDRCRAASSIFIGKLRRIASGLRLGGCFSPGDGNK